MASPDIITLKPKPAPKPKKRSVSFKVPAELGDDLDALKERVKRHAGEVDFNLDTVLADHLAKLVKQANRQLDKLDRDDTPPS